MENNENTVVTLNGNQFYTKKILCDRCMGSGSYTAQHLNTEGTTTPTVGSCFKCNGEGSVDRLYLEIPAPINVLSAIADCTESMGSRSKMCTVANLARRTNFLEEDIEAVIGTFIQIGYIRYYKTEQDRFYGLSRFGWSQLDSYRMQSVSDTSGETAATKDTRVDLDQKFEELVDKSVQPASKTWTLKNPNRVV